MHDSGKSTDSRRDRSAALAFFLICLLVYAWFFAGDGFNQFSHFDTTRAIVERGSFEITPYAHNTMDVSVVGERVFSNKPPGLALFASPVYAVVEKVQRARGANFDEQRVFRTNLYLVTIWACAVPGAILSVAVFWYFRRSGLDTYEAMLLAGAFAFGTLVMPYASVMMVHNLVAMCLFVAWLLVTSPKPAVWRDATAGALLGLGVMTEYLVGPLILLFVPLIWRRERWTNSLAFAIGPILAVAALTAFHVINFGSAASSTYTAQQNEFRQPGLFLGVFDWPDPRRLYWLTFHSFRGLFYACPVLMLSLFAFIPHDARTARHSLSPVRGRSPRSGGWKGGGEGQGAEEVEGRSSSQPARPSPLPSPRSTGERENGIRSSTGFHERPATPSGSNWFPLAVCAYFLLFNLTFNGWTGGWSVGPRYLIPAIPFLYVFARDGFRRFPRIVVLLIAISVCNMLATTSVRLMWPANNFGPPPPSEIDVNPIGECYKRLTWNQVARNDGSFNIGQLMELDGIASIAPPVLVIAGFFGVCLAGVARRRSSVEAHKTASGDAG